MLNEVGFKDQLLPSGLKSLTETPDPKLKVLELKKNNNKAGVFLADFTH